MPTTWAASYHSASSVIPAASRLQCAPAFSSSQAFTPLTDRAPPFPSRRVRTLPEPWPASWPGRGAAEARIPRHHPAHRGRLREIVVEPLLAQLEQLARAARDTRTRRAGGRSALLPPRAGAPGPDLGACGLAALRSGHHGGRLDLDQVPRRARAGRSPPGCWPDGGPRSTLADGVDLLAIVDVAAQEDRSPCRCRRRWRPPPVRQRLMFPGSAGLRHDVAAARRAVGRRHVACRETKHDAAGPHDVGEMADRLGHSGNQ